jgi:hypothetical protein
MRWSSKTLYRSCYERKWDAKNCAEAKLSGEDLSLVLSSKQCKSKNESVENINKSFLGGFVVFTIL